ncbi:hypothetical protein D3C87_1005700 [compost metagenome]
MADVAGGEVSLEVVVHGELADVFVDAGAGAPDVALIIHFGERVGTRRQRLERQVRLGVAQVLLELPDIVQTMFEGVAQRVVGAIVIFPVRITQILVVGNITER